MNFMQFFKFLSISVLAVAFIVTVGYLSGYEDATSRVRDEIGKIAKEVYNIPDAGGVCRSYCVINDKDMYEVEVKYTKLEVNN